MSIDIDLIKTRDQPSEQEIEEVTSEVIALKPEEIKSKLSEEFEIVGVYTGQDYINAGTANHNIFNIMKDFVVFFIVKLKSKTLGEAGEYEFNFQHEGGYFSSSRNYGDQHLSEFAFVVAKVAKLLGLYLRNPQYSEEIITPEAFALQNNISI